MKKIYKNSFLYLLILFLINSCFEIDCKKLKDVAKDRECLMIFEDLLPYDETTLNAKGTNILDGKSCICKDRGRWWVQYRDELDPGDTIIKRKGELTFNIHKKDTVITHHWQCEGKVYNSDGTVKEVLKKR
ncbi:hypothetical protein QP547_10085 [Weeksella virosa]|uniref:hypothetical protein n=1 Tax=Weeksella virosa TaxID=1014 RepID=UPI002553C2B8|nr:hypothetical protein [Weeksella virosa]MDK7676148.1 hypothetical protein [Weeksella virosa]